MALGQYRIKVVPVLDTASLKNQLDKAGTKSSSNAGKVSGDSFSRGFLGATKERLKYSFANMLVYGTQNAIKDMVNNVKELDKAQTELKKVSDLSGKSLEDYTAKAYKMGDAVAKTGTEIIQTATEFKKQGFDANTSLQLSDVASQFRNIADTEIDAATAAKFINSQIKAFGDTDGFKNLSNDAEKATKVIDSVNEVANNFGVGTNDLQMALTKTGAALKGYGNSYSETIGLITAGTEMLPNQASKVARGWRTIGANILKLAQSEETLEAANGKVNISMRDSEGNMRSTYDILKDLHEGIDGQSVAWKDLSQEEQSAISLMLAGKTQTEVFKSTMDNYTQAIRANETATNAQGSAARENARYLDSLEGHVNSFRSAWQQLSYHLISSDMLKAFVDLGTKAVKAIDSIWQAFDKLPGKYSGVIGLLGSIGAIIAAWNFRKIKDLAKVVTPLTSGFKALLNTTGGVASGIGAVGSAAGEVAEEAAAASAAAGAGGGLAGSFGALVAAAAPLVTVLLAVGGAFLYANHQYKNSFKGKLESYKELGDEITNLEIAIEDLKNKEGDLTAEEESRLKILEMQLDILRRQEEIKAKQLTAAFNNDAHEAMRGKTHMEQGEVVTEREDTTGDKYLQALEKRYDLERKIQHLEDESRMHPLTEEQQKDLEKYNKQLDKVYGNEYEWLERLAEEHENLSYVNYDELDKEGKGWYDNIHSAFLQSFSDIEEVRNGIAQTIDTFGSAQFDSWDIDVSSLKSASDLATQISSKIKEMGEDEEITLYARDETGVVVDEIKRKKSDLTDEEWELVVNATATGDYEELLKTAEKSEHKEILMDFVPEGVKEVEEEKKKAAKPIKTDIKVSKKDFDQWQKDRKKASDPIKTKVELNKEGFEKWRKDFSKATEDKETKVTVSETGTKKVDSDITKASKDRKTNVGVSETGNDAVNKKLNHTARSRKQKTSASETGSGTVDSALNKAARGRKQQTSAHEQGSRVIDSALNNAARARAQKTSASQSGAGSVNSAIDWAARARSSVITVYKKIVGGQNATGKRKGEKGGASWLGDEGTAQNPKPELVVTKNGAYLAGTTGWEMHNLKSEDIVYSYSQTKKLLGKSMDISGYTGELPKYAKGKKAKTHNQKVASAKKALDKAKAVYNASKNLKAYKKQVDTAKKEADKAKKAYNKKKKDAKLKKKYQDALAKYKNLKSNYDNAKKKGTKNAKKAYDAAKKNYDNAVKARDKQRSAYDSALKTLEYKRQVNDWTDEQFRKEYEKLKNKYAGSLSTEQLRAYNETADQMYDERAKENASRYVGLVGVGKKTAAQAVKDINNTKHLSADEKKEYRAQAYKASVEYNLKEYQNGKKTRQQILDDIKNYYKTRGVYDEEYYKMVDELREADKQKELQRLTELQEKEDDKLNYLKKYAQQQKDYYDEQVKKEQEEAEALEQLVELQDKLNNAKKTMVKVYREGVGFVYEQDTEAVREAQKALDDYNKSQQKTDLEKQADQWQAILDAIGQVESEAEMNELALKLGINGISDITGNIGLDPAKWADVAKTILTKSSALADIISVLEDATGADIEALIGATMTSGDKTITSALLNSYIDKHSFASGTLNAPSGISLVGENGAELAWLNKGSAVFNNAISRNLMEWGQYSPAQLLSRTADSSQNQVFNFDKIVLPNVRNAEEFYNELQSLPNMAIQQSTLRA